MILRAGVVAAIALLAQAASACITVDVPPRERFHGAAVVVLATAGDLFVFRSEKSWRGGIPRRAEFVAEYDPVRCGAMTTEKGQRYLIYADQRPRHENDVWILSRARFLRVENAQREIAFLERRGAKAITRGELARVLDRWKSGRISHDALRTWLVQASERDVDDWVDTPDAGPVSRTSGISELLLRLLGAVAANESTHSADCVATIIRSHVGKLQDFLQSRELPVETFVDDLDALEDVISEEIEAAAGC